MITWQEIRSIDWEEEAEEIDERSLYRYRRDTNGQLINEEIVHDHIPWAGQDILKSGGLLEDEKFVYRGRKLKRKNALNNEWRLLFKMMELIAQEYGEEHVRLIAWFCS